MKIFVPFTILGFCLVVCLAGGCSQQQMDETKQAAEDAQNAATDAVQTVGEAAGQMTGALSESFAAAAGQAATALKEVEGGGELLQNVKDFFGSAKNSLQGVTDGESAKAALSELSSLSGSLDGWSQLLDKLPTEAKTAVQGVISQGITALKTVADKVMALPGVSDVLQPKLDEMMDKLQSFTG